MINKELTTNKTKELEKSLDRQRIFSEKQILSAENDVKKWMNFIIAESGWGKIEIIVSTRDKYIDVKPTISLRHYKEEK